MRLALHGIAAALLVVVAHPAPVLAQPAAQSHSMSPITVGMTVKDPQGGIVGTVTAIDADLLTVKTDKHEAQLPRASFALEGDHALFGMTQAQLDATIEQQLAAANARIAAGAEVVGLNGTPVGTIDSLSDQYATVKLTSGKLIRLQRSALAPAPQGARIGMSAAALDQQVAASTTAARSSVTSNDATTTKTSD